MRRPQKHFLANDVWTFDVYTSDISPCTDAIKGRRIPLERWRVGFPFACDMIKPETDAPNYIWNAVPN